MTDRSSFGPELRRAREARGLTLEEIAEVTKVSAGLYRGLENNDLSHWPSGLFRRAFVRNYAQAVGLDPEETCRRFVRLFPEEGDAVPEMHAVPPPASAAGAPAEPPRLVLANVPGQASPRSIVWRRLGAALADLSLPAIPALAAWALWGAEGLWITAVVAGSVGHVVALSTWGRTVGSRWLLRDAEPAHLAAPAVPARRQAEGPVLVARRPQAVLQAHEAEAPAVHRRSRRR